MATVTYHIYSHNNHDNVQSAEAETSGYEEEGVSIEDEWQQAAPRASSLRHSAPHFVPATISYDEWCSGTTLSEKGSSKKSLGTSVSGWYRSLTSSRVPTPDSSSPNVPSPTHDPSSSCLEPPSPYSPQPTPNLTHKPQAILDKNNWFIKNAIRSEPSSSLISTPSLAEILARDPPPLPSEQKYTPPVWLEIGPSNKGFGMLQRAGWNEGEALGPDVVRRMPLGTMHLGDELFQAKDPKGKAKAVQIPPSTILHSGTLEINVENPDGGTEPRQVEVIDLSLESDEDVAEPNSEDNNKEEAGPPGDPSASELKDHMQGLADKSAYKRKALLTPIATVLKSDRLGIGLKAKTVGPYKASQKRVTHNAAALTAHIQAAKESQKRRQQFGRGRRGFERQNRQEEDHRKEMIAYLKSS